MSAMIHYDRVPSPIGDLLLLHEEGALVGLYTSEHRCPPEGLKSRVPFPVAARQLTEYFAGDRRSFDLNLAPRGTEFQKSVWTALGEIPFGETRSYGELAKAIGRPTASRAVGAANGANPISIIVPCHRVIGASGKLTGYAGGLETKQRLLEFEGAAAASLFS